MYLKQSLLAVVNDKLKLYFFTPPVILAKIKICWQECKRNKCF